MFENLVEDKTADAAETPKPEQALYSDDELINLIDHLLDTMDQNKDGYVDYTEYRTYEPIMPT